MVTPLIWLHNGYTTVISDHRLTVSCETLRKQRSFFFFLSMCPLILSGCILKKTLVLFFLPPHPNEIFGSYPLMIQNIMEET